MNTGYLLASLKYFAMGFIYKKKKSKVYCFLFGAISTLLMSEGITEIYSVCTFYQVNAFMIV